jgi:hypothetical protein
MDSCSGPDTSQDDNGRPTAAEADCSAVCSTNEQGKALCSDGNWTCSIGDQKVGGCCTNSCLDPSCCFPNPCHGSYETGSSAGAGGGAMADCHGQYVCDKHMLGTSCDPQGNCTCLLDGQQIATCHNASPVLGCAPVDCCILYFGGC